MILHKSYINKDFKYHLSLLLPLFFFISEDFLFISILFYLYSGVSSGSLNFLFFGIMHASSTYIYSFLIASY